MKHIKGSRIVNVPRGVKVTLKGRSVTVTGPKGTLTRDFAHTRISLSVESARRLRAEMFQAGRTQLATLRTICSHIENMITGVTKGYLYKMRLAYNHFPINVEIEKKDGAGVVEIRNFVGQKIVARVAIPEGVTVIKSDDVKDQLEISGIDIEAVSGTASSLHHSCLVRNKDIRKFLDGIFVSEKGPVGKLKAI